VKRGVLLVLAVGLVSCAGSGAVAPGEGCPLPIDIGTGGSELRVDAPQEGYSPKVSEQQARDAAEHPVSAPGDPSTVIAFRLGRVTLEANYAQVSGQQAGPFDGTEAWVQLRQVAEGPHLPNAGNGESSTTPYRWAVLINAETGVQAMWEGGDGSGCS